MTIQLEQQREVAGREHSQSVCVHQGREQQVEYLLNILKRQSLAEPAMSAQSKYLARDARGHLVQIKSANILNCMSWLEHFINTTQW